MKMNRLNESKKNRFIKKHPNLTPEQKEELILLYSEQYIPDDIVDWNIFNSFSYEELYNIVDTFIKEREEKINKKNLSKAIEGRDYIKIFENKNSEGTEYLYLPLTWLGSKYLASDHFLPKIKVPSKQMDDRDFSDNLSKNMDLSHGAKWCISLWTIPDYVALGKFINDENGKEFRHEGKKYWLWYTSEGAYFLFYFRDYSNLEDRDKKIAFTLNQGSSKIVDITLADNTRGGKTLSIKRVQKYWNKHYKEYKSQIEHIQEISKEDYPKFRGYEEQKEQEAREYYNSQRKKSILRDLFTYNESTGRYDSKESISKKISEYLVKDGEFTVPLGVINGNFDCSYLGLNTLRNGPTEVTGNFLCYGNNLTSLEYAPQKVGGYFDCSNSDLINLEGAPKTVEGYFTCSNNLLKTLKGAPEYVGEDFYCSWNELTTLEGAPKEIGGNFHCCINPLQSWELSTEVKGIVYY